MIGIQDSQFRRDHKAEELVQMTREGQRNEVERMLRDQAFVTDWDTSVSNPHRQMGLVKDYRVLDKELQELNPQIRLIPDPANPTKAFVTVQGVIKRATERTMPEFSIMATVEEEVPIFENRIMKLEDPSMEVRKRPGREVLRGWRTLLLILIKDGHLTLNAVEKKFGSCERPSWVHHTGKQKIQGVNF